MKLLFASHNAHKLSEISAILAERLPDIELEGIRTYGLNDDIPETADTLSGNALQKARYVYERLGMNCFADDTGLEVEALDGAPGVYTARFAGEGCSFDDNVSKLLRVMQGEPNRRARFRTVVALILDGKEYLFEGEVKGFITTERKGTDGFGYDPIFQPEESGLTFAEMGPEEKNRISHRARAIAGLTDFLASL